MGKTPKKVAGNSRPKVVEKSPLKIAKKLVKKKPPGKKTLRLIQKLKNEAKRMGRPVGSKTTKKIDRTKSLGTFIYLGLYGKGEAIRMLLYHAKILYDMVVVTLDQVKEMKIKGQLPANQVPVWVTPEKRVLN